MKYVPVYAALFGAVCVIMAASGAHLVRLPLPPESPMPAFLIAERDYSSWNIAVSLGLFHVLAALCASLIDPSNILRRFAGLGFCIGATLFSGAVWANLLSGPADIAGPLAPVGGITLIVSWVLFAIGLFPSKTANAAPADEKKVSAEN